VRSPHPTPPQLWQNKKRNPVQLRGDPKERIRLLDALSKDNTPEGSPIAGGSQEMTVLKELSEMEDAHDDFMQSLKGE
jgi:hypothetical protein